jgi:hypothetical protein
MRRFPDGNGILQWPQKNHIEHHTEKNANRSGHDCSSRDLVNHALDPFAIR